MSQIEVPLPVADLDTLRRRRSVKWKVAADAIPLPVAEMDFDLAPPVKRELLAAVERSDTGYSSHDSGVAQSFAAFADRRWDWQVDPEITFPVGDVGVGNVELLRVICQPGDQVVISTPVYAPFFHWIAETHLTCVEVPLLRGPDTWSLDLEGVERAFAAGAKAYLLCNPHNPVGFVPTIGQLQSLVDLAHQYGVTILSDEIHAPLVYADAQFTPLLTLAGASEVAISVVSASKAWNLAGLKCALIVPGSARMADVVRRIPEDVRWRVGHFGAIAAVAAYDEGEPWLDALVQTLHLRRERLGELIADLPGVSWIPPQATYLAWLNCAGTGLTDPHATFAQNGVLLDPGLKFGAPSEGYVRLNFATSEEILTEALGRMRTVLS